MHENFVVAGHLDGKNVEDVLSAIDDATVQRYGHIMTSHHVWVENIRKYDPSLFSSIEEVRGPMLLGRVKASFPGYSVVPVPEVDELYWAVSPKDASGSDRTLVDCHYDAPFGGLFGSIVFHRVIVACNENTSTITTFPDTGIRVRMTTGDFHGIDYNRDLHCVEGSIPQGRHRVLLKLHYMAVPLGAKRYASFVRWMNLTRAHGSRDVMRMSSDPTTVGEHCMAFVVNSARIVWAHKVLLYIITTVGVLCVALCLWGARAKRVAQATQAKGVAQATQAKRVAQATQAKRGARAARGGKAQ
eukprot:gene29447-5793_t